MIELSENISGYILNLFGDDYLKKYKEFIYSEYTPYLRFSYFLEDQNKVLRSLKKYGITLQPVPAVPNTFVVLSGVEKLGKTLEFALGKYYIQSLSSMIPALVLNPSAEDKTIDLCAAPGSKTTLLAELMSNCGTLYANEINIQRIKALVYNIDKMNYLNVGVIRQKGEILSKIYNNYFDKILVDAPCSALGIIQKRQEVSNWWSEKHADRIADLQTRLIVSAVKMVKSGGEIVYSTCTLTVEENELIINKVLKNYPVELMEINLPVESHEGITHYASDKLNPELSKTRRIVPWEVNSEGFFIAKLRKLSDTPPIGKTTAHYHGLKLINSGHKNISRYLEDIGERFGISNELFSDYKFLLKKNDIYIINREWEADDLSSFMRIGIKFGSIDKRDMIHIHTNTAQVFGKHNTKNYVEIDIDEAATYLSGGTLKKGFEIMGQKIIKFKDEILGTAVATKDGLKSQFPRAVRTHEIILPSDY